MALPAHASPIQTFTHYTVRVFVALVLVYLIAPVLVILPLSVSAGEILAFPLPGYSLKWYRDFFHNPLWTGALLNSLFIAAVTTILATALGTLAALGLHFSKFRLKPFVMGLLVIPLAVPVVIVAVAAFYFFARLQLVGTYISIIAMHIVLALPFVLVTVLATLQGFDPNLVRAAASLGATPAKVLRTVTLPVILPGVVSGALFAFVTSFDEIVVALFLATPDQRTLPRQIFSGVKESISPTVTVAAVILLLVSVGVMIAMELLRRRSVRLMGSSK